MALKTVLDNFAKARNEYEEREKKLGNAAQKEIASAIAAVLPKDHVFVWTQATPYFNDGEACVFRIGEGYVLADEQHADDDFTFYNGIEVRYAGKKKFPELAEVWSQLTIKKNEPLMRAAFGDHAMVCIKPDGSYERSSYEDHD